MNIRDLEYLIALDQHQHFGKAAIECHVSQPTLSGQFKKLEQELGVQLLDRSAKGVVLSGAGKSILSHAKTIMSEVHQIQETGRFHQNPRAGYMRIATIPTVGPYLLPHILDPLRKAFPDMKFYLHEMKTEEIIANLNERQIDLGILALSVDEDRLEEMSLYNESFQLAMPKNSSKKISKVSQKALMDEPILLLEEGHCLRDQALFLCRKVNLGEATNFKASSIETLRSMVEIGEGITPIPELTALSWKNQAAKLDIVPFPSPVPQREIGLLYPKHSIRRDLYIEIGNLVKKKISQLLIKSRKKTYTVPLAN